MPIDRFANMEEKLWILEDLNMMYIRQIALSLQVIGRVTFTVCVLLFLTVSVLFLTPLTTAAVWYLKTA